MSISQIIAGEIKMKHLEKPINVLGSLARASSTIISSFILAAVLVSTASATHFRYGQITWTQVSGNTVEATVQQAWRRASFISCVDPTHIDVLSDPFGTAAIPCSGADGLVSIGDVAAPFTADLQWGDGISPTTLYILVTSVDLVNNWFFGVALDPTSLPSPGAPTDTTLSHTYPTPGDYTAFFESCCRISPPDLINNADGGFSVETIINAGGSNNSPVSVLPPIVRCPVDSLCSFFVPGADVDGDTLIYRLSLSGEAKGIQGILTVPDEFVQPGFDGPDIPGPASPAPGPASIDPITGQYSWDTTGAGLSGDLYSTQVTIEDGESKIAVDFLIQLAQADPNPPNIGVDPDTVCLPTNGQTVVVGSTLNFGVTASDSDGDELTLNVAGLPAGASMTPQLPLLGSPSMTVSSTFSWTPVIGDVGTSIVNFTASNFVGGFALCPVTIEVKPSVIPVAVDDPGNMANSGQTISIDVLFNDLNLDDGVDFITTTSPASGGTAIVKPDNTVDYTSSGGFDGTDTFTYTITDLDGDVSPIPATVTIEVDGSVAVTVAGLNPPPVFGGAAIPGSDVPLSAAGANALTSGTSSVQCCTVRDWRVGAGNTKKEGPLAFKKQSFDIGVAMSNPALADADCADMPKPAPGELVMPRYFGVHTNPLILSRPLEPEDFRFGICVVLTDVLWRGPVFLDVVAENVVGYAVNCSAESVDKQPITAARTTDRPEFSEEMRSVSSDCDPKGIGKWSTFFFSPNVQHLTDAMTSEVLLSQMSSRLKGLIEAMRAEGAVNSAFLDDVKSFVLDAEKDFKGGSEKEDPKQALLSLDHATRLALLMTTPPLFDPYGSSASFSNPQGELVSHIAALRYGVCSELAFPNSSGNLNNVLNNCEMPVDIVAALPALP